MSWTVLRSTGAGFFVFRAVGADFFPGFKMGLYQCGGLFKRDVADDGQDDLGRGVFPSVEGLHIGQGHLVERLFRSIDGPTVGVSGKTS